MPHGQKNKTLKQKTQKQYGKKFNKEFKMVLINKNLKKKKKNTQQDNQECSKKKQRHGYFFFVMVTRYVGLIERRYKIFLINVIRKE